MSTITNTTVVYQFVGFNSVKVIYIIFTNNLCDSVSVSLNIRGYSSVYLSELEVGKLGAFTSIDLSGNKELKTVHVDVPVNYMMSISFSGPEVSISKEIPTLPNSFPINAYNIDTNEVYPICNVNCIDEIRCYDVPRYCKPPSKPASTQ